MKRRGLRGWWDMLAEVYPYTQSYPNAIPSPFPPHPHRAPILDPPRSSPAQLPCQPPSPVIQQVNLHSMAIRCDEGCVRDFGGFWELGRGGRPGGIGG